MADDADQNRLTLNGVGPVTLFFADRPERIAGNMTTKAVVPFWGTGKDSFLSDPPNADLSIIEDGALKQTVVVLRDPVLEGEDLHYTVQIISGDMPELGTEALGLYRCRRHALAHAGVLRGRSPSRLPSSSALLTRLRRAAGDFSRPPLHPMDARPGCAYFASKQSVPGGW